MEPFFSNLNCLRIHRLISRYHPVPMEARKTANASNLQARVAAFMFLMQSGRLDKVPLNYCSSADEITKAMDAGEPCLVYAIFEIHVL